MLGGGADTRQPSTASQSWSGGTDRTLPPFPAREHSKGKESGRKDTAVNRRPCVSGAGPRPPPIGQWLAAGDRRLESDPDILGPEVGRRPGKARRGGAGGEKEEITKITASAVEWAGEIVTQCAGSAETRCSVSTAEGPTRTALPVAVAIRDWGACRSSRRGRLALGDAVWELLGRNCQVQGAYWSVRRPGRHCA